MIDSKVYIALSHLNAYELNSYRRYLDSPYFNVNESLITLFDIYVEFIKNPSQEELTKEAIWNILYPKKEYKDAKYRKVNSDLLKSFESFLAQKSFDDNKYLKNNLILEAVRKRKIEKLYLSLIHI